MTTLREIIDNAGDVSQLPFLAEYKRLYEQNDKLIEIAKALSHCIHDDEVDYCTGCPMYEQDGRCIANKKLSEAGIETRDFVGW